MKTSSNIISINLESFNRNMWRYLVRIQNDEELKKLIRTSEWGHDDVVKTILSMPQPIDIDFLVLSGRGYSVVPLSSVTKTYSGLYSLSLLRWHPFVGIKDMKDGLSLTGSIRIEGTGENYVDIFLVKDINRDFCERLTYNTTADLLLINNNRIVQGTFNENNLLIDIPEIVDTWSYKEYFGIIRDKEEYNAVLKRMGIVYDDHSDILFLSLFSNYPYTQRIERFSSRIILVVFLSAILAAFTSLLFSKTITRPIEALSAAMEKIQSGDLSVVLPAFSGKEVRQLVTGFNTMAENLKEDKRAQQNYINEIMLLSEYNEEIIESIGSGICIIDKELCIEKTNKVFRDTFLSNTDLPARPRFNQVESPIFEKELPGAVNKVITGELTSYSRDKLGTGEKYFQIRLYPLSGMRCILSIDDITYRTILENRFIQSEKLSSLSIMSAGVAHEINNPLSSIMTNVQNLIDAETNPKKIEALKWVDQETGRIARIVRDLLDFSNTDQNSTKRTELKRIITKIVQFSSYSISKKNIKLLYNLPDKEIFSSIPADEIKQVLFNLLHNAEQAIESRGEIMINLSQDMDTINLSIEDNGTGMDKETLGRIFDPFFTTKKGRDGTGLGLSVVYGIMKKNNADINFESSPGKGTTVLLRLPSGLKAWSEASSLLGYATKGELNA
ncbi:MAG: HAMP domain-containing protein [Spirochaetales bacterium]|nr:HAMP domain-containing protein [Spirochaetales bacterium]